MTYKAVLIAPVLLAILTMIGATAPNVYARHLSDTQRYNDGYSNGSDAAARDSTYNAACDPTGAYTSDGQHSTTYCTGWANGYAATWNSNHGSESSSTNPQQTQQSQQTGTDWNNVCSKISFALIPSCSELVNSDNTLTQQGEHVKNCIENVKKRSKY